MDYILLALEVFQTIIALLLAILMTRMYLRTRYRPTALLAIFYWIFTVALLMFIPTFWIPISGKALAVILSDVSFVLLFIMFPFLIMAFEGMKGRIISSISAITIGFTAYVLGFVSIYPPRWDYEFIGMWWQVTDEDLNVVFALFIITMAALISYRLVQFVREKETARAKKYPSIAMVGFLSAVGGAILAYVIGIPNIDFFAVFLGSAIVAIAYLKDPSSFFISNTNIKTVMLIDNRSKMPYLTLGQTAEKDVDLTAAGLGGVMLMLQEILESEQPPTRLIHANQGFLIEYDQTLEIIAVVVVDQINDMLRPSLKYALNLFISQYRGDLQAWKGKVDQFQTFVPKLKEIFKFAMLSD